MHDKRESAPDGLTALRNIGPTLAAALADAGVRTRADLVRIGAPEIYRRMQAASERRLPLCYYLYSLEGAIRGIKWDTLTPGQKQSLRLKAGLTRASHSRE